MSEPPPPALSPPNDALHRGSAGGATPTRADTSAVDQNPAGHAMAPFPLLSRPDSPEPSAERKAALLESQLTDPFPWGGLIPRQVLPSEFIDYYSISVAQAEEENRRLASLAKEPIDMKVEPSDTIRGESPTTTHRDNSGAFVQPMSSPLTASNAAFLDAPSTVQAVRANEDISGESTVGLKLALLSPSSSDEHQAQQMPGIATAARQASGRASLGSPILSRSSNVDTAPSSEQKSAGYSTGDKRKADALQ